MEIGLLRCRSVTLVADSYTVVTCLAVDIRTATLSVTVPMAVSLWSRYPMYMLMVVIVAQL